ncbi:MAG: nucleoside hydrolase [Oscillospiraceae bacterium]|nr:nucleoside hydrolase [Oscillospiraceae bacterium]
MNRDCFLEKLKVPTTRVDVVLDTDCFNEIDDQFALAYLLRSPERVNLVAISAAPFLNKKVQTPAEGMDKSYQEILKVLELALPGQEKPPVWRGSEDFLPDERTPVKSQAAGKIVELAMTYTPEKPLYVVAIGAVTNVASALLMEPAIKERIVLVWLGGHARHYGDNFEFNLRQDVASGRVVFSSGVPMVQLPCRGVVSQFATTRYELEHWMLGKNPLSDYLASNAIAHCEALAPGKAWSKPLWDVTAVAWLCNDEEKFMMQRLENVILPEYDHTYDYTPLEHKMQYVYYINRDVLFADMLEKLTK